MKNKLFWVLFIVSAILHIIYITHTSYLERCHDIAQIHEMVGHSGYIQYILLNNLHLPNISPLDVWQFYHPPLHHFLSAAFIKILISSTKINMVTAFEYLQFLTVLYSLLVIFFTYKICQELKFNNWTTNLVTAFIMFHPSLILTSGCVNNDMLCFLLCTMGIWYLIKWNKKTTIINSIILALITGLAVVAKLSGLILLPAILSVIIYKIIVYAKQRKELIKSCIIYLCTYMPIAAWWNIRCLIKYKMPLFYINHSGLDDIVYNNWLYDRILCIQPSNFATPFLSDFNEINMVVYMLKSSIFGEYSFSDNVIPIAETLLNLNILLTLVLLIGFLYMFNKKQTSLNSELKLFLSVLFVSLTISYLKFNIEFPAICTQDFRYVLLYLIIFGITFGALFQDIEYKQLKCLLSFIIILFALYSILFFSVVLFCKY